MYNETMSNFHCECQWIMPVNKTETSSVVALLSVLFLMSQATHQLKCFYWSSPRSKWYCYVNSTDQPHLCHIDRALFGFPEEARQVVHIDGRFDKNQELINIINLVDERGVIASLPTICDLILVSSVWFLISICVELQIGPFSFHDNLYHPMCHYPCWTGECDIYLAISSKIDRSFSIYTMFCSPILLIDHHLAWCLWFIITPTVLHAAL